MIICTPRCPAVESSRLEIFSVPSFADYFPTWDADSFTINAVGQDEFSDVKVPETPRIAQQVEQAKKQ
jgi:hypothetical protein